MIREVGDVDDLGQEPSGDDGPQALNGDDGIGNGGGSAGDALFAGLLKSLTKRADVVKLGIQGHGIQLVNFGITGIEGAEGSLDGTSFGIRGTEVTLAALSDQIRHQVFDSLAQVGNGQISQNSSAGELKRSEKGRTRFESLYLREA